MRKKIAALTLGFLCLGVLIPSNRVRADGMPLKSAGTKTENVSAKNGRDVVFKDGDYRGISPGWTGMKVEVRIRKGKISTVRVIEVRGTPRFYQAALDSLPKRIVSKNSVEVNGISGASLSSGSLKQAVQNALEKAR